MNWVKVASAVNGKRKYVHHIRNLFQLEYKIGIKSVRPFTWCFKILCSIRERARAQVVLLILFCVFAAPWSHIDRQTLVQRPQQEGDNWYQIRI